MEPAKVVQFDQLVAHGVGDAFAAIADVDGPDPARNRIQMLFAVLVPDAHTAALDNDARVGFGVGPGPAGVLAEVVPDMGAVGLDHMRDVVVHYLAVHERAPSLSPGAGGVRII